MSCVSKIGLCEKMNLCGFEVGLDQPFFLIAGPCAISMPRASKPMRNPRKDWFDELSKMVRDPDRRHAGDGRRHPPAIRREGDRRDQPVGAEEQVRLAAIGAPDAHHARGVSGGYQSCTTRRNM